MTKSLFTILILIASGAIFFFYTKPVYDGSQTIITQMASYDAALSKAAELQQLKQTLLTRYNAFDPTSLDRLQKLLPDHVDNIRLVLDLDNLASRHAMALENVDVSSAASASAAKTVIGSGEKGGVHADSLTLRFSTQTTYPNFISFLKDLEASLRIVDLVSLTIAPSPGAAAPTLKGGAPEPLYAYDITIRTYWLK